MYVCMCTFVYGINKKSLDIASSLCIMHAQYIAYHAQHHVNEFFLWDDGFIKLPSQKCGIA